jgi:hypothetical protein
MLSGYSCQRQISAILSQFEGISLFEVPDYAAPDGARESFCSVFYSYGSPTGFAAITDPVHFSISSKPAGLVYL